MTTTALAIHPTSSIEIRRNKNGKILGERVLFGSGTFKGWRESLKASGMSAKEAKLTINEALRDGEGSLRWAQAQVALEGLRHAGHVPDLIDTSKATAVMRFSFVPPAPKPVVVEPSKVSSLEEEIAKLKAENAALKAAKQ